MNGETTWGAINVNLDAEMTMCVVRNNEGNSAFTLHQINKASTIQFPQESYVSVNSVNMCWKDNSNP